MYAGVDVDVPLLLAHRLTATLRPAASHALMQRGDFSPLQRELIATAVSMANACHN